MSDNPAFGAEKLTRVFLKIKTKRAEITAAFKEEDEKLVASLDLIKNEMLSHLQKTGSTSAGNEAGMFYRSTKAKYWTSDWESMHKFILAEGVPEFLAKTLNQGVVKQYLEENPDKLPKGLNVNSEYTITVRKK
tara:strand:- start:71 stop:472 length:402 start_codon:yes stop_codon:yes gene_type:complete